MKFASTWALSSLLVSSLPSTVSGFGVVQHFATSTTASTTSRSPLGRRGHYGGEMSPTALHGIIKKFIRGLLVPEIIEDVHLPTDLGTPARLQDVFRLSPQTNAEVVSFVVQSGDLGKELVGAEKDEDSVKGFRDLLMEVAHLDKNIPSEFYNYWGKPENRAQELRTLCKSNAFFAQALTESPDGDGYEIISYDPTGKNPTRFSKIVATLSGLGRRVNFKFNKDLTEIISFTVYDDLEGVPLQGDLDMNKYACSAMYNLLFYSSCVHAVIHVLHFLCVTAFESTTGDFEELEEWAITYQQNIAVKYAEVGALLIADEKEAPDYTIITGKEGFGSSQEVRPFLTDILNDLGESVTHEDFFKAFFNVPVEKMKEDGILTEYIKHTELAMGFAKDAAEAAKSIDDKKFRSFEDDLEKYLDSCGAFKSRIKSFEDWLSIMSMTGQMHGGTLSYTRLIGCADVMAWRKIKQTEWDAGDSNIFSGGLGTITGMQDGHHVMSATNGPYEGLKKTIFKLATDFIPTPKSGGYARELQAVMDEYDRQASIYKNEYQRDLFGGDFDTLNDYGWILTDWCNDDRDGKQQTVTTYI